ncbi:MAG: class I SAM-dependent RNA methyltransferase [Desulfosudaceae bacterium]
MKTRLKKRVHQHSSVKYIYQEEGRYIAQVAEDLSGPAARELAGLGATDITPLFRSIHFKAPPEVLYLINYRSRLLSRVLAPLISFACDRTETIYEQAKILPWTRFFPGNQTFAVSANVSDSDVTHSHYAALRLKDAVVDYFRENTGRPRPNVNTTAPDVPLNLHLRKNQATISLDTSGIPLHKRGYREETVSAPMQETVAAGIINLTEWDGSRPLYDPLCGSGTLLCEALMLLTRVPAGIFRDKFGFESLPDFDKTAWQKVRQEADARIRELPENLIGGSDIDPMAVNASKTNLMGLHYGNRVALSLKDFRDLPNLENHLIVTNPPYGIRMSKNHDLMSFYKDLGDFLKQKCRGSIAYVYLGDRSYIKYIGLKTTWKKPLHAGGLDGRLLRYDLY